MSHFRPILRDIDFLLPPSVQDWLPDGHLARYVVEIVEGLDLREIERAYAGRGSLPYHPALLLSLLIDGYATGCFSSRKIERATDDSLAFRFIAANTHPDHDTLATFRKRFAQEFEAVIVQVLQVARENQLSRFGTVSLDGTKIHANASRHSALSFGHAEALEAQLKAEVQERLALAEAADGANLPDGMHLPEELKRREDRLAAIAAAKVKIEARAAERDAREQAEYEAKLAARAAKVAANGRKPGGKAPQPPTPGPRPTDQINLTDEESRIMPVAGGGFEQCYNAQALVDTETMLVMIPQVTQATNDKQQIPPLLERLAAQAENLPPPKQLMADTGFFSEANVVACESVSIEPLIAIQREEHHPHWSERFKNPPAPPPEATPVERMVHRHRTPKGRATYALRKQTVEPVFGIIKSVMGFRQFLTRGLDNVRNEWTLVCLAWNFKRMAVLRPQ
ncbi:IS5/IS1182 family transposase [Thiocystis minor]|uniref:transposase n=1 Tax=Thiocystis minor TaxID=61597 RepID=UPI001912E554|nr:transposase [Thiocystis minor]MBK5966298.1 IS5/IS1182 family transposase [Thiocystis minor]